MTVFSLSPPKSIFAKINPYAKIFWLASALITISLPNVSIAAGQIITGGEIANNLQHGQSRTLRRSIITTRSLQFVEPTPSPTPDPTPEPTPDPTPQPTDDPTPGPTDPPTPSPSPRPTPDPTPQPTDDPTPGPTDPPTPSPSPRPTPQPTPPLGADYCTFSPRPDCFKTNGKPECCSNNFIECPEVQPPCDVITSPPTPSPTPSPTLQPTLPPGEDYCTYVSRPECYKNGKPECCTNNFMECPEVPPPCEISTRPTLSPTPGPSTSPSASPTSQAPTKRTTKPPTKRPTNRPTDRPTKNGDTPSPTFKETPSPTPKPTRRPTPQPTKKGDTLFPTVKPSEYDYASCTAHESCQSSGLEGRCCPTLEGNFLDCCDRSSAASTFYSLNTITQLYVSITTVTTLFVAFTL